MKRELIHSKEDYSDYLKDASLLVGTADELVFCHTTEDVIDIVNECYQNNKSMTIQGGMTGICGGAVPNGGCVINLSEMNAITGLRFGENKEDYYVEVEPGLILKELNSQLNSKKINTTGWPVKDLNVYEHFKKAVNKMFPPDPTETLATIGGMVACNASGACSFKYGGTRKYVEKIKVVTIIEGLAQLITLKRGQYTYGDINHLFKSSQTLPSWHSHNEHVKDVAGLFYEDDLDLIDLFIGMEGLFGVITEIELKLMNAPEIKMGLMLFLDNDKGLVDFINWLRGDVNSGYDKLSEKPCAIEYFDQSTLEILNEFRTLKIEISQLPVISTAYQGGLYLEFHLKNETQVDEILTVLSDYMHNFGINEVEQWLALEASDFDKLKNFRHSVPECVNILVSNQNISEPNIKKVGTDMAVPNMYLADVLKMYHIDSPLKTIVFGHIGDNHLHVNMIPNTIKEYQAAQFLVKSWAEKVIRMGGTVTAEHGIGKLKKTLLKQMMSDDDLNSMKIIKKIIEPSGLINQGTLFD